MATAANAFLSGLTPEQRQQAALPFEGEERMRWNFIPNEMFPRKGLMLKSLSEAQRAQAHALLKTGLSQKGYMTATSIMDLENVLRAIEAAGGGDSRGGPPRFARDPLDTTSASSARRRRGRMGLASRRPSRVAALHGPGRQIRRELADVLRHQPRARTLDLGDVHVREGALGQGRVNDNVVQCHVCLSSNGTGARTVHPRAKPADVMAPMC